MTNPIFFFLMFLLVPSFAYAQESTEINYDKCENEMLHQNIYAPFYYHINHDPAISQTFKQRHVDNPNVSPFQRAPETIDAGYATWFEFGTSSNQTATYEFELDLEYLETSELPRPITIQLFSTNGLVSERKIFQEEKIGCMAFRVATSAPPHVFTQEEILEIAKLEFVGITKQFSDKIDTNTDETRMLKQVLIVVVLVFALVCAFLIIGDRMRKREMNTIKEEYGIRNDLLATSILKADANVKMQKLSMLSMDVSAKSMTDSMVGNFGVLLQKMYESTELVKSELSSLIKQLRHEIELYEPVVEKPVVTFIDSEEHDSTDDCVIIPKVKPESDNETIKSVFGFDFSQIKNATKQVMNIVKKQPELSDVEKLKEKWSKMSNDDISTEYSSYVKKSEDDMIKTKSHGVNFEYAKILIDIINQRQTDYKEDK